MKFIDIEKKEISFEFYPVSSFPKVEYTIFIIDSKDFISIDKHCYIFHLIEEKLYKYKEIIISNDEELIFNSYIKLGNICQKKKDYILLIIAKEIINSFPNYKFYEPYKFKFKANNDEKEEEEVEKEEEEKNEDEKEGNKSNLVIIIIIISVLIFILFFGFIIFFMLKRKK